MFLILPPSILPTIHKTHFIKFWWHVPFCHTNTLNKLITTIHWLKSSLQANNWKIKTTQSKGKTGAKVPIDILFPNVISTTQTYNLCSVKQRNLLASAKHQVKKQALVVSFSAIHMTRTSSSFHSPFTQLTNILASNATMIRQWITKINNGKTNHGQSMTKRKVNE